MSNAHPSTGLQNSYKYHINYIYSTINNNIQIYYVHTLQTEFDNLFSSLGQFKEAKSATMNIFRIFSFSF